MDFELFTRAKAARLRAQADALDATLREFENEKGRTTESDSEYDPASDAYVRKAQPEPRANEESVRTAFANVLRALDDADDSGMSHDDMAAAADAAGTPINRNTLRSALFSAKQSGRIEALERGRYRGSRPRPQTLPTSVSQTADYDDEIPF